MERNTSQQPAESASSQPAESSRTSEGHALAIGYYIGALLLIFGVSLVSYGIFGPAQQTAKSLGININLWWGLFMSCCGLVALGVNYYSRRRR